MIIRLLLEATVWWSMGWIVYMIRHGFHAGYLVLAVAPFAFGLAAYFLLFVSLSLTGWIAESLERFRTWWRMA